MEKKELKPEWWQHKLGREKLLASLPRSVVKLVCKASLPILDVQVLDQLWFRLCQVDGDRHYVTQKGSVINCSGACKGVTLTLTPTEKQWSPTKLDFIYFLTHSVSCMLSVSEPFYDITYPSFFLGKPKLLPDSYKVKHCSTINLSVS